MYVCNLYNIVITTNKNDERKNEMINKMTYIGILLNKAYIEYVTESIYEGCEFDNNDFILYLLFRK